MAKCQTCNGAGWVKFYTRIGEPGLPTWLTEDGDGVRWQGDTGYYLCGCPQCNRNPVITKKQERQVA